MDSNKYYYEEMETLKNWRRYLDNSHKRNNQMWNSIEYNQFVNEEVNRLNRKVYYIKDDLVKCRESYDNLKKDNDILISKLDKYKEKEKPTKRKASELTLWYNQEKKKKPKNYNKLKENVRNNNLLNIFANLKSLDDIIAFENNSKRFDYLKNKKFEKLYKLIPSCKNLNGMIGLDNVKKQIFNQLGFFLHGLNNSNEINHIVITGEPGVGKTSLSKILGKIYLALGFLKNDTFVEAKRSDLIGQYCGHTAIKTQKVIDSAEGGVLLIDEVYSLGNKEKKDSFTKECIDTINQNLTEKGDKFLCIIVGYKEEVQSCFFNYNKGLERRFPVRFELDSYNETDLKDILLKFMKDDNWGLDEKVESIDNFLTNLISKNKNLLKFQAGDIRTIFQLIKENYSLRLLNESIEDGCGDKILSYVDFENGIDKFKKMKEDSKEKIPDYLKNMYV